MVSTGRAAPVTKMSDHNNHIPKESVIGKYIKLIKLFLRRFLGKCIFWGICCFFSEGSFLCR